jgi:hypothetical protein
MPKQVFFLTVFVLALSAALTADTDWQPYCPIEKGLNWKYVFFSKKENKQKDDIRAFINKTEKYEGEEYFVYEIPSKQMYYYFSKDSTGIYVKAARICLPVLEFINLNISFYPSVCVLKFPFVKDESWTYDGIAHVGVFAFIDARVKFNALFTMHWREYLDINGEKTPAFRLSALSNRRWEKETPISGDIWLAKNCGVVKAETKSSLLEMKTYTNKEK